MSILDAYDESTQQVAKVMDAAPLPEPVPEPKHSAWTVVPRALAGAALEVAGNLVDVGSMIGQVAEGETRDYGDFEPLNTRPEASRPHYEMAREMRPDPLTAGLAENVIFGVGKGLSKAAFAVTAGGVLPGAAAFGLSEGMTTSEDLAEQGVDAATRQKVGTVTGVVSGASVLLPVAGTSLLKTAGLVAAGGPAAYIAQETIIKDILEEADYQKIADQHDPLDPVGLAVSTLLPAAFGAMAMRGAFKGKATQEQVDAAMVHNTTLKADQFEAETPQAVEAMKQAEESVKDIRATYEHTGDIGKAVTERLMDLGVPAQEAADKGLLWDSFFKSMESRTGQEAGQLFGKYFDRVFNAGEALPDDAVMQGKSYGFDQIQTQEFKAWSGDAPFIPREEANVKAFKTGEPVVVEAYHGTGRPDRVGEVFKKSRATSGPMAFHTSNPELASGYASGKQDTSLALEDQNYSNWFKFKPKGERSPIDIERAWHRLDPETKAKIEEIAPTLRQDEDGNVISEPGNTSGNGSYDYNLSETRRGYDKRGNPLKALVEDWLNSGVLFDDEEKFMQVLQQAGFPVKDVTYDSPHAQYPFVYKNFIRMKNPLVTDDIPQSVIDALNTAAKRDRSRAQQYGADMWDKNTKTLKEWVQYLNDPSTQQHAWTSIPDKVTKILKELGYDGIIDESGKNGGEKHPVYIPFEENQVKSAIGNKGKFGETSNILKQSAPIFYSQLSKSIEDAPAKVFGTGKQLKEWITANAGKLGVKKDEIEATGLNDWLSLQGKVSKEQVQEFLANNGVKVEEVTLGKDGAARRISELQRQYPDDVLRAASNGEQGQMTDSDYQAWQRATEQVKTTEPAKFEKYQLPGGENYRELLLTLPPTINHLEQWKVIRPDGHVDSTYASEESANIQAQRRGEGFTVRQGETKQLEGGFRSSHFDQPNILAHVRFNERTDADGKRVLFLEEIQSDWAQKGRKEGFKPNNEAPITDADRQAAKEYFDVRPDFWEKASNEDKDAYVRDMRDRNEKKLVPSAPFVTDTKAWTALALKRMIRYAAENGFDRIAWTNGEQQAARYDLSKQVDRVAYNERTGTLMAWPIGASRETIPSLMQKVPIEDVGDYIGKDAAEKLVAAKSNNQIKEISGIDLKVGGEGMRGFYDQIVPQVANDVLKKLGGGKVGDVRLDIGPAPGDAFVYEGPTRQVSELSAFMEKAHDWPVSVKRQLQDVMTVMDDGKTFVKAIETEGSPALAEKLGGKLREAGVKENEQPGFDITPALREKVMGGMPLFQKTGDGARGFLEFGQNGKMGIGLLASADKSTFLHESGHFFLEVMNDLSNEANAPPELRADMQAIHEWMGVSREQWASMSLEQKRPYHEQWARGFEQYLMEGKAPTSRLKEAFARFRDWLIEIYKSATALNVTLSDDVRKVMDNMLTVKESEPRQSPTGDGVPPPRASIGEDSAGNSDLDKALTSGEPLLDKIRPLDNPDLVSTLQDMAANEAGWAEKGGNLMREFGDEGDVTGRTQWIPKAEWWPDRPGAGKANRKLNEAQVAEAVRKHLAGEPLKSLELQTVEYMSKIANDRLNSVEMIGDQEFGNTMQDWVAESIEPTTEKVFDSQAVARALDLNPEATMQAMERYDVHDDDAIIMAEIRSIIDEAGQQSLETAQGRAEDTGKEADPIQSEAERIVAEDPERRIPIGTGPDGEAVTLTAREYLDQARAQADQARQDVNLIKAAAECLLGQI